MAGICGVFSKERCVSNILLATHYLQHRAQDYCGIGLSDGKGLKPETHKGLLKTNFSDETTKFSYGNFGIGCVTSDRQPVASFSKSGGMLLAFDGNVINYSELRERFLEKGESFLGYREPEEVNDSVIISKIISSERNFVLGIGKLIEVLKGDFSIIALTNEGIYAARGYGRKPLILGKNNSDYMVSSESVSFNNTGFEIIRDVNPGEVIHINERGIVTLKQFDLPVSYGTFEWIYTADPASVIDGISVAEFRIEMGKCLARRYPIEADFIAPIPNSGIYHAIGYSWESKIPFALPLYRYPYSDRSFTPSTQEKRDREARTKLNSIKSLINGKSFITIDDSIVRGTQYLARIATLRNNGATKVHARIAMPPLKHPCLYGKTTKKGEIIAAKKSVEEIKQHLGLDSLGYGTIEDINYIVNKLSNGKITSLNKLCLECI